MFKKIFFLAILLFFSNFGNVGPARGEPYMLPPLNCFVLGMGSDYLIVFNGRRVLPLENISNLEPYEFFFFYAMSKLQGVQFGAEIKLIGKEFQVTIWNPRLVPGAFLKDR